MPTLSYAHLALQDGRFAVVAFRGEIYPSISITDECVGLLLKDTAPTGVNTDRRGGFQI